MAFKHNKGLIKHGGSLQQRAHKAQNKNRRPTITLSYWSPTPPELFFLLCKSYLPTEEICQVPDVFLVSLAL